eukprot:8333764-Pyramimonas_sp.AAC.1
MLSPFDEFVSSTSSIGRTVDLYVDDITVAVTAERKFIVESSVEFLAQLVDTLLEIELTPAAHKMTVTSSDPQ